MPGRSRSPSRTRRGGWVAQNLALTVFLAAIAILFGFGVAAIGTGRAPVEEDATTEAGPVGRLERASRTFYVARIVDGDTLELGNGRVVRLVGIDAPEVGKCGYAAASDALAGLVLGKQVRLTVSDENTDQCGRLLRYVDIGSTDAGLRLIERGLAIARYDSRDGYGYHPRERSYIASDAASRDLVCWRPATAGSG